jgi:hypothetical protein
MDRGSGRASGRQVHIRLARLTAVAAMTAGALGVGGATTTPPAGAAGSGAHRSAIDASVRTSPSLNAPVVGMAVQPDRTGFWMVAADGGVFTAGKAAFHGSTGDLRLNRPIVGMASTPSGQGYWLVAADGGIFSFGDAAFYGSTGAMTLNRPIVGMTAMPNGKGYWLAASDGGIFSFGQAGFHGSTGGMVLNQPIVSMAAAPDGKGYWLVAADGGIFSFGDATYVGSAAGLGQQIVGMGADGDAGYWLTSAAGDSDAYGTAAASGISGNVTGTTKGLVPPANPPANIPPSVDVEAICHQPGQQPACIRGTVTAIDAARAEEGVGPLVLPTNFAALSSGQQLFVLTNLERVDRGLTPIAGMVSSLDGAVVAAAQQDTDPGLPGPVPGLGIAAYGSNWALTGSNVDAMYYWMYYDGMNSGNIDCTSTNTTGCWGHRDILLGFQDDLNQVGGTLVFDAASTPNTDPAYPVSSGTTQYTSVTCIVVLANSVDPAYYTYTWAQAVAAGAK